MNKSILFLFILASVSAVSCFSGGGDDDAGWDDALVADDTSDDSADDDSAGDDTQADDSGDDTNDLTGTGQWEARTPLQMPRSSLSAAAVDGKIYAMGGMNIFLSSSTYLASVEVYDVSTDTWEEGIPLPQPRMVAATGVIDGKIYLAGGYFWEEAVTYYLDRLDRFDPDGNFWVTLAPMPTPRSLAAGAVLDGKFYVMGGRNENGKTMQVLDTVEVYDPGTDEWTEIAPLAKPIEAAAAVTIGGFIFLAGGFDGDLAGYLADTFIYDPHANAWYGGPAIPSPRCSLAGTALFDRYAIFIGGYIDGWPPFRDAAEAFDTESGTWVTLAPLPEGRGGLGVATASDRIFAVGGGSYDLPTSQPWYPRGEVWEFIP
jgi:hypothetical protein